MKILFLDYDYISHDQRALETIDSLSLIGDVTVLSLESESMGRGIKNYSPSKRSYALFLLESFKLILKSKPDVIFLHDYYCALVLWFLKSFNIPGYVFYDSSELYYDKPIDGLSGLKTFILNVFEKRYIGLADTIFAANIERAQIMKDIFQLETTPLVIDNIHRIDEPIDYESCSNKFDSLFSESVVSILYCGGISKTRRTYELINTAERLGRGFNLIIAGAADDKNKELFEIVYNNSAIKNFCYLGFLNRSELKYLLNKSDISVSLFDFSCVNNVLCASGKVYESIFERTPVLTTTNPPLRRLCDSYKVGVSTNDFYSGILQIMDNYSDYLEGIDTFISTIDYDNRIRTLADLFLKVINKK